MKVYINQRFQLTETQAKQLTELGAQINYYKTANEELLTGEIIVDFPEYINHLDFDLKHLKFVQLMSAGFESLAVNQLKQAGVKVANGRGLYSDPIAEYVLAYILATYKNIDLIAQNQAKHHWQKEMGNLALTNQKILILGTGSIGQAIAKRAQAFEMEVVGLNSTGHMQSGFSACYPLNELDKWLAWADIVVGALPANPATYHLLDQARLELMQDSAILINVGRGTLIKTEDLLAVLPKKLKKVILDVLEIEPLPIDHPLWEAPKVVITPHLSGQSSDNVLRNQQLIVKNLSAFLLGQTLINEL